MSKTKKVLTAILALLMLTALAAPVLTGAARASHIIRRLSYGDSGQDVLQLQNALKKLGYFYGKLGGNYLDLTQAAVRDFEYAHGDKLTWYCTTTMQQKIYDASQKEPPWPERTLHYGDSGDDVKALQKALKKLGYFGGDIGGNYLRQTRQAVKDFQEDYGYKPTNYCTAAMQVRIRNAAK